MVFLVFFFVVVLGLEGAQSRRVASFFGLELVPGSISQSLKDTRFSLPPISSLWWW